MVGYGLHSFQSICIILMAWCCMICLEDSSLTWVSDLDEVDEFP